MAKPRSDDTFVKGRFFKKDDPVLRNVEITEYSLMEVCEIDIALADNSFANIYHKGIQVPADLDKSVRGDKVIQKDFNSESAVRDVLGPENYTEDWEKQKEAAQRNYYEPEDDEATAEELSLLSSSQSTSIFGDEHQDDDPHEDATDQTEAADGFKTLVDHVKDQPREHDPSKPQSQPQQDPVAEQNQNAGQSQLAEDQPQIDKIADSFHAVSHNQLYDVEPLVASADSLTNPSPQQQEASSSPSPVSQEPALDIDGIKSAAFEEGVAYGRQLAEEQAQAETQEGQAQNEAEQSEAEQQLVELAQYMSQTIAEVVGLKEQLLDNSRQNFKAIAKTMVGAILQKQIALNPESLDRIISRAIQEAIKTDQFAVKVHSTTYDALKDVSELADKLVVDDAITEGHFKVESDLSVIDGNLDHIVSTLLDEADLDLFADEAS